MSETTTSNGNAGAIGPTQVREGTTLKIVSAVAEAKGCEPWDLEPLSRVTDPDAIESLLDGSTEAAFEIRFEYEGGVVTVSSDGGVEYEPSA